jgi:hypothetical protein
MSNSTDALDAICSRYKFTQEVRLDLDDVVGFLKIRTKEIWPEAQTPTQRASALAQVAKVSSQLHELIAALEFHDRLALDDEFFKHDVKEAISLTEIIDSSKFDVGLLIAKLPDAADVVRNGIAGVNKPGRSSTVAQDAQYVGSIAQRLKPTGIALTASGKFLEVVEAVYEAAELKVSARVMTYFFQHVRPDLKAAGHCL